MVGARIFGTRDVRAHICGEWGGSRLGYGGEDVESKLPRSMVGRRQVGGAVRQLHVTSSDGKRHSER